MTLRKNAGAVAPMKNYTGFTGLFSQWGPNYGDDWPKRVMVIDGDSEKLLVEMESGHRGNIDRENFTPMYIRGWTVNDTAK